MFVVNGYSILNVWHGLHFLEELMFRFIKCRYIYKRKFMRYVMNSQRNEAKWCIQVSIKYVTIGSDDGLPSLELFFNRISWNPI